MEAVLQGMGQLICTDMPEKPKGFLSCQSSLQRSRVPLQARVGKDPGPGPGTARAKSVNAAEPPSGAHGDERELQQRLQWGQDCDRVGSTKGKLQPVPSLLPYTQLVFSAKKKLRPWLKRAMFPNICACVSGSGGPFIYYIFPIINGEILTCLLIETGQI